MQEAFHKYHTEELLRQEDFQYMQKVAIIAPVWEYIPILPLSLICQRHKVWELILMHDGPCTIGLGKHIANYEDRRINYQELPVRKENFGHPLRNLALNQIHKGIWCPGAEYIVITNGDNYYAPGFLDFCLSGFGNDKSIIAVYMESMVHNYFNWGVLTTALQLGHIDICCMMIRKDAACEIGWPWIEHSSDWTFISKLIERYGSKSIKKIPSCQVVHN